MTDDQLENLLVRHGEAWRSAQPAAPSLSAMTGTPAARAPWLLPALVAAALLVPVVGTVVLLQQRHDPGPPVSRDAAGPAVPVVVPWADLPATAAPDPARLAGRAGSDQAPPEGLKQCGAGDFAVGSDAATSTDVTGAAPGGSGRYVLTVQRAGTEPCAIGSATPTVRVLDAAGHGSPRGVGDPLLIGYPGYTLLQPGDVLQVPVAICGTGIASIELRLASAPDDPRRSGGPGVAVAIPFTRQSSCTSGTTGLSHQHVLPAGSLASLVRSYSTPGRVRSGQSLDYTMTLTNPTASAVSLDPCPSYRQALIDVLELPDKRGATSTNQLNCAAAPASVPAHSSITFQLRLDTEAVPAGDRRLIWDWLGSTATDAEGYGQFPTITVY